jgi:hypothetical protein
MGEDLIFSIHPQQHPQIKSREKNKAYKGLADFHREYLKDGNLSVRKLEKKVITISIFAKTVSRKFGIFLNILKNLIVLIHISRYLIA